MQSAPRPTRVRRSIVAIAALLAGLTLPLAAQNTVVANLQGDPSMLTPGGWVWPAAPADNPQPNPSTTYLDDRVQLGKALFWDEQVSTSNTMSCGTCHIPEAGGTDPRGAGLTFNTFGQSVLGSFGVVPQAWATPPDYGAPPSTQSSRLVTDIHVPTMIGAYMFREQFWDLRAGPTFVDSGGTVLFPDWAGLENQAEGPVTSPIEMAHQGATWVTNGIESKLDGAAPLALVDPTTIPTSIPSAWLSMSYAAVFDAVFAASGVPSISAPQGVSRERFAMAIAAYTRTLIPDQAPIDTNTMTVQELEGFDIFVFSQCAVCHSASGNPTLVHRGPIIGTLLDPWDNLFSDGLPHDIFLTDPSRQIGPVKTPTLRNLGLRQRFFHDGHGRIVGGLPMNSVADLVDFYAHDQDPMFGGPGSPFQLLSPSGTVGLSPSERAAVIAFLGNALTDPRVATASAPFDRPTLFTESNPFGANLTQPSTQSGVGWWPRMIADVPPLAEKLGTWTWWKVGVGSRGTTAGFPVIPTGSPATLWFDTTDSGPGPLYLPTPTALMTLPITPEGFATAHAPIPLNTSMLGMTLFLQWEVVDAGGWTGFSEPARFTVF